MPNDTRFSEVQKTLTGRWKPGWSADNSLSPLVHSYSKAMNSVADLMAKKTALRSGGKFSDAGLIDEVRALARNDAVPALRAAALAIERAGSQLKESRSALALRKVDPTNGADAVLRAELRTWMRSLPQTQAIQTLLSEGVDERLVQAALEGPPVLSGLTDQMRAMVERNALEREHGPALAALDDKADAIETANSALQIALYQFREEAGFAEGPAFDKWMEEVTAEIERREVALPDAKPTSTALQEVTVAFDEIFAKAFPTIYPDHPVNQTVA